MRMGSGLGFGVRCFSFVDADGMIERCLKRYVRVE